jgi:hypothetical protein
MAKMENKGVREASSGAIEPSAPSSLATFCPAWIASADSKSKRWFWFVAGMILTLGAGLRLVGLFGDFWLDEIWSWAFARNAKSVKDIFFSIHHDNNHYLNTLWIYVWGQQTHWLVYRLHSYIAGVATIIGCGLLAGEVTCACESERNPLGRSSKKTSSTEQSIANFDGADGFARVNALVTMSLVATCQFACVYSTEARGYAMAGAAAVFSTLALRRVVISKSSAVSQLSASLTYALLASIGFLSHLTFAAVFLSQFIWSSVILARRFRFLPIIVCYLPVSIVLAVIWNFDLRFARVGGAPRIPSFAAGLESLALPTGVIYPDWLVIFCAGFVLCGLLGGLYLIWRRNFFEASLFGLLLLVAPPLMYGLRSDGLLCSRHFFVVWMLLFPLLGLSLVELRRSSLRQWIFVPAVFWLATNGWEFSQFAMYGRGAYVRSIDWLFAETQHDAGSKGKKYTIGSDHDFRNGMVLSFYIQRIPDKERFVYLSQSQWPAEGVDWLFVHSFERYSSPLKEMAIGSRYYDLRLFEPYSAPVGWNWSIYRRRDEKR